MKVDLMTIQRLYKNALKFIELNKEESSNYKSSDVNDNTKKI